MNDRKIIYLDDAIDAAKDWYEGLICGSFRGLEKRLKSLPSAQPERKTGKWIVHYECPKCGEITKDFTEYCPFCDADMRGEQDETSNI